MSRKPVEPKTPLGKRLADAREALKYAQREPFAEAVGLSVAMVGYYERGDRVPDALALAAYHERFGVNINWLVTGDGDMFEDASKAPAPSVQVDPLLMEKLYKAVDRVYRDMGQKPPPHRIAHEATTLFNVLVSRVADVRDEDIVDAVIPVLAKDLVDRLERAAAEPGTGKRSA